MLHSVVPSERKYYFQRSNVLEYRIASESIMERSHREAWYQSPIWSMIESCLDKLNGVEAAIGESANLGSKRRMNEDRHISAITSAPRLKCGYKCDFVFANTTMDIVYRWNSEEAKQFLARRLFKTTMYTERHARRPA
ncbi:unnamed protein product [Mucor hiemalis]